METYGAGIEQGLLDLDGRVEHLNMRGERERHRKRWVSGRSEV